MKCQELLQLICLSPPLRERERCDGECELTCRRPGLIPWRQERAGWTLARSPVWGPQGAGGSEGHLSAPSAPAGRVPERLHSASLCLLQAACVAPPSPTVGRSLCPWSPGLGRGTGVTVGAEEVEVSGKEGRCPSQAPCSTLPGKPRSPYCAHQALVPWQLLLRLLGALPCTPAPGSTQAARRHCGSQASPHPTPSWEGGLGVEPRSGGWSRAPADPSPHLCSLCRERDRRAGPRGHDADRLPGDGHQDPAHQECVGPALPAGAAAEPDQHPLRGPAHGPGGSPCSQRHPGVAVVAPGAQAPSGTRRLGAGLACFLPPS